MPDLFRLNQNDTLVRRFLTQAERGRIQNAHTTDAWDFEFHTGHETGTPLYIRPRGCTVHSNLTKFDTRTRDGRPLQYNANNMHNADVIERTCKMQNRDKELMYRVVSTNWDLLCEMARRYKAGDAQGEAEQARLAQPVPAAAATRPCKTPNCTGTVMNVPNKAGCAICGKYT